MEAFQRIQVLFKKAEFAIPSEGKIQILFKELAIFKQFQERLYQDFKISDPHDHDQFRKPQMIEVRENEDIFCMELTANEYNTICGYDKAYHEALSKREVISPMQIEEEHNPTPSTSEPGPS